MIYYGVLRCAVILSMSNIYVCIIMWSFSYISGYWVNSSAFFHCLSIPIQFLFNWMNGNWTEFGREVNGIPIEIERNLNGIWKEIEWKLNWNWTKDGQWKLGSGRQLTIVYEFLYKMAKIGMKNQFLLFYFLHKGETDCSYEE